MTDEVLQSPQPSLLDEAKKVNEELKANIEKLKEERQLFERSAAEMAIAGKSFAGTGEKEKTQAELDQEEANKIIGRFTKL